MVFGLSLGVCCLLSVVTQILLYKKPPPCGTIMRTATRWICDCAICLFKKNNTHKDALTTYCERREPEPPSAERYHARHSIGQCRFLAETPHPMLAHRTLTECICGGTSRRYYIARDPLTHFPQAAKVQVGPAGGYAA